MKEKNQEVQRLYESSANLYRGFEGAGGRLILSDDYLLFEPHALNIQKDKVLIKLKDIQQVQKSTTLGIIPNSFEVIALEDTFKFVVKKRNEWIRKIETQINKMGL